MSTSIPNERILRQITIASLFASFPLIIASGVMSSKVGWRWGSYYRSEPIVILFGLIPVLLSAFTSMIHLKSCHDPLHKRSLWHSSSWFLIDAFLVMANFAVLIPVWIIEPEQLNGAANYMMLETYATVFLLISA